MPNICSPVRVVLLALRACALVGLICGVAAGCGLQATHQASGHHKAAGRSKGGGGKGSGTVVSDACTTARVVVTLDVKSAGVAAGTSLMPLDITNVGTATCRLAGFAFVTFATSRSGGQVGAASTADRSVAARTLLLGAGQTAHLWLKIAEAADLPTAQCQPRTVAGLRVRLPGQETAVFIAHQFMTCAKRVHGTDILTVEPFQAGRAHLGTAQ
jgi:hypothetical protein